MTRTHKYSEPLFTLREAVEKVGADYETVAQWLTRGLLDIGARGERSRRLLYSVADLVTIALISSLHRVISMRAGIATAFIDKAQQRLAEVARRGLDDNAEHYLIGWQSGPEFSVLPLIKMRGVDWAGYDHPVAVVPIDRMIKRIIAKADEVPA